MDLQNTALNKIIIHHTGNKNNAEPIHLSQHALNLDEETRQLLGQSFLARFKNNHEYFSFSHPSSLQYNEVYNYCREIFSNADSFEAVSHSIAKQLYNQSTHPRIKGGDLYIVYFDGVPVDSRMCAAVGFFKAETKTVFLDTVQKNGSIELLLKEGI